MHLKEFIVLFRQSNQPTERRLKRGTCATAGYDARAAVKPVWPERRAAGWVLLPKCLITDTVTSRREEEEAGFGGGGGHCCVVFSIETVEQRFDFHEGPAPNLSTETVILTFYRRMFSKSFSYDFNA